MKRLIIPTPGRLELIEDQSPQVRPLTVKIQVSACGVCGSDVALWQGHRDLSRECYFGHEFTGVITEVGPGVSGLKEGMRVASGLIRTCGRCWYCRNGHPNYCRNLNEVLSPGGFASETLVEHTEAFQFLTPMPPDVDDLTGTLHETISCVLRIIDRSVLKPDQSVLIFGLGAIGILAAELLRGCGAGVIVGIDLNLARLTLAKRFRIDQVVNRRDQDWLDQVYKVMGFRGADLVIEVTGSPQALGDALMAARLGGRIVVGSVYHEPANKLDVLPIMRKELTVVGAKGPFPFLTSNDYSLALRTLVTGGMSTAELLGIYSPEEAVQAFQDAVVGHCIKSVIKFRS